jgi:hypothetical protein
MLTLKIRNAVVVYKKRVLRVAECRKVFSKILGAENYSSMKFFTSGA